jgi:hypothetical protein
MEASPKISAFFMTGAHCTRKTQDLEIGFFNGLCFDCHSKISVGQSNRPFDSRPKEFFLFLAATATCAVSTDYGLDLGMCALTGFSSVSVMWGLEELTNQCGPI